MPNWAVFSTPDWTISYVWACNAEALSFGRNRGNNNAIMEFGAFSAITMNHSYLVANKQELQHPEQQQQPFSVAILQLSQACRTFWLAYRPLTNECLCRTRESAENNLSCNAAPVYISGSATFSACFTVRPAYILQA